MRSVLAEVGLALAGRAGARLADVFGTRVSRNTVLQLVDALPAPQPQVPRVVSVDEYAMRKADGREDDHRTPSDRLPQWIKTVRATDLPNLTPSPTGSTAISPP